MLPACSGKPWVNCTWPVPTLATTAFWHASPLCGLLVSSEYWTLAFAQAELSDQPLAMAPEIAPPFRFTGRYGGSMPGFVNPTRLLARAVSAANRAASRRARQPSDFSKADTRGATSFHYGRISRAIPIGRQRSH